MIIQKSNQKKYKHWQSSGCTFIASIIYKGHVTSCSIGDSCAFLVNPDQQDVTTLTRIYSPHQTDETDRIRKTQIGNIITISIRGYKLLHVMLLAEVRSVNQPSFVAGILAQMRWMISIKL